MFSGFRVFTTRQDFAYQNMNQNQMVRKSNIKFFEFTAMFNPQEVCQDEEKPSELLFDKHVEYVVNHGNDKNDFVSYLTFAQLADWLD